MKSRGIAGNCGKYLFGHVNGYVQVIIEPAKSDGLMLKRNAALSKNRSNLSSLSRCSNPNAFIFMESGQLVIF